MELPIDETKLHHPFDRHVFAVSALLNLVLLALALFIVIQGSEWLRNPLLQVFTYSEDRYGAALARRD